MKTNALFLLIALLIVSSCRQNLNQPKVILPNTTGSLKIRCLRSLSFNPGLGLRISKTLSRHKVRNNRKWFRGWFE